MAQFLSETRYPDTGIEEFSFIDKGKTYTILPKPGKKNKLEAFYKYVRYIVPRTKASPWTYRVNPQQDFEQDFIIKVKDKKPDSSNKVEQMKLDLTASIDKLASKLETQGNIKEAYYLDIVSNTIEAQFSEDDRFIYPNAGEDSQPEVKSAINRFHALPYEERMKSPLLFWLLGESTQDFKITKKDSQYVDETLKPDETCGNCLYGYTELALGNIICSQIQGYIKKAGWCNRWKEADSIEETIYQSEQMKRDLQK